MVQLVHFGENGKESRELRLMEASTGMIEIRPLFCLEKGMAVAKDFLK